MIEEHDLAQQSFLLYGVACNFFAGNSKRFKTLVQERDTLGAGHARQLTPGRHAPFTGFGNGLKGFF